MAVGNEHGSTSDGKMGKWRTDEVENKVMKQERKEEEISGERCANIWVGAESVVHKPCQPGSPNSEG